MIEIAAYENPDIRENGCLAENAINCAGKVTEEVQARIEMKRTGSFSAEEDASVSKYLAEPLAMGKWCGFPGLPCLLVFFDSLLSSLVPVCLSFSLFQPTYAPVRLLCSPRCSAQTFFFSPLKPQQP